MADFVNDPIRKNVLIVNSEREGFFYCYDEAFYVFKILSRHRNGTYPIKCEGLLCKVTGILTSERTSITLKDENHTHEPNKDLIDVCLWRQRFFKRIVEETKPVKKIYEEEEIRASPGVKIPSFKNVKTSAYNRRKISHPQTPKTFLEICAAADSHHFLARNNQKLFRKSINMPDDSKGTLIFISPGNLEFGLAASEVIYVDGTFKSAPYFFYQLVSIHYQRGDEVLPAAYILMKGKRRIEYENAFREISTLLPTFRPRRVMSDYEIGLQKALKVVFPGITTSGCWFHHCQCLWRNIQERSLVRAYFNNQTIQKIVRMLMAVPLLKEVTFDEAILYIDNKIVTLPDSPDKVKLRNYMENYYKPTWMKKNDESLRRESLSVYGYKMRTNNAIEGFHKKLKEEFGTHPPFLEFMKSLVKLDKDSSRKLNELESLGLNGNELVREAQQNQWRTRDRNIEAFQRMLYRDTEPITIGFFLEDVSNQSPRFSNYNITPPAPVPVNLPVRLRDLPNLAAQRAGSSSSARGRGPANLRRRRGSSFAARWRAASNLTNQRRGSSFNARRPTLSAGMRRAFSARRLAATAADVTYPSTLASIPLASAEEPLHSRDQVPSTSDALGATLLTASTVSLTLPTTTLHSTLPTTVSSTSNSAATIPLTSSFQMNMATTTTTTCFSTFATTSAADPVTLDDSAPSTSYTRVSLNLPSTLGTPLLSSTFSASCDPLPSTSTTSHSTLSSTVSSTLNSAATIPLTSSFQMNMATTTTTTCFSTFATTSVADPVTLDDSAPSTSYTRVSLNLPSTLGTPLLSTFSASCEPLPSTSTTSHSTLSSTVSSTLNSAATIPLTSSFQMNMATTTTTTCFSTFATTSVADPVTLDDSAPSTSYTRVSLNLPSALGTPLLSTFSASCEPLPSTSTTSHSTLSTTVSSTSNPVATIPLTSSFQINMATTTTTPSFFSTLARTSAADPVSLDDSAPSTSYSTLGIALQSTFSTSGSIPSTILPTIGKRKLHFADWNMMTNAEKRKKFRTTNVNIKKTEKRKAHLVVMKELALEILWECTDAELSHVAIDVFTEETANNNIQLQVPPADVDDENANLPVVIDLTGGEESVVVPPATAGQIFRNTMEYTYRLTMEKSQCSICKIDFLEEDLLMALQCCHYEHSDCLRRWLFICGRCPTCQYKI